MRRSLLGFILSAAAAACGDHRIVDAVDGANMVLIRDECDPATFNAALGPGACVRQGNVTFDRFMSELTTTQRATAWQFVPPLMTIRVGQSINVQNQGGEIHTFTRVSQFGGGVVPELNTASGNRVPAAECVTLPSTAEIVSGGAAAVPPDSTVGTALYQCCIHPWMRTTVHVVE